jgi:ATP-dependent Clp protease ATP-binding subunit ClpC
VADTHDLEPGLRRRLSEHCLERRIESLAEWNVERDERLDVLDVDADAPTILPRGSVRQKARKKTAPRAKGAAPVETEETPEEKEQRRARARLSVRTLRQIGKNLTHQARDGELGRAFGREGIVSSLVELLEKRNGAAVVLVGQGGVGKPIEFVTSYSDYRRVDGVLFAFSEKNLAMGQPTGDTTFLRVQLLPEAPAGTFAP